MTNALSGAKLAAEIALGAITVSACVIPDAWAVAAEAYKMQGDPGAILDAGTAWLDSAEELGKAIEAATNINNSLGGTYWEGEDYTAFTERTADYIRQMMLAQLLAYTTGIALIIAAITTFISILILCAMAVGLGIWAGLILAAMASVVGFAGPVEALELDASLYAVECEIGLRELDAATKISDGVLAGGIGLFLGVDVVGQMFTGNPGIVKDLGQATVDGLGTIAAGLTAKAFQELGGKAIAGRGGIGFGNAHTVITGILIGNSYLDDPLVGGNTQGIDPVSHDG